MRLLTLLAVLPLGAGPALAQDEVRLSPNHPDLSTVEVEDELLAVYMGAPGGRVLGTITRTVTPNDDGSLTVVTDADAQEAGFVSQDSARYGDVLTPIFMSQEAPFGRGEVTVAGTNVSGTYARGDMTPLPFDIDLEATPFDPVAVPLVARSLPLREGYEAIVPTFSPTQRVRETTLTVIGEEEVTTAEGESRTAWVVEEDGGRNRRFFVDGATRDLVQITISPNEETTITLVPTTAEALAAAVGPEAAPIRPGDASLMADRLGDYQQDYTFKVVQPVQQDIGTQTRHLTIDEDAGTVTLVTTTLIAMANQTVRDSLVAAWPSFEPISRTLDQNGTLIELAFADGEVRRTQTPAEGDPEETEVTIFDEPIFDTGWIQEIVRTLPLADGYRISYQGVGPTGEANAVLISVLSQEEMDGGPAWVVETVPSQGPPTTFTVDDATREVLKTSFSPQVGVLLETVPAEADAASE